MSATCITTLRALTLVLRAVLFAAAALLVLDNIRCQDNDPYCQFRYRRHCRDHGIAEHPGGYVRLTLHPLR